MKPLTKAEIAALRKRLDNAAKRLEIAIANRILKEKSK